MVAVLSYQNWHDNYASDSSVVGSTFWINTKPVHIVGIAPQGFYGDRLSSTPPDYYMPIQSMDVICSASIMSPIPRRSGSISSAVFVPASNPRRSSPK